MGKTLAVSNLLEVILDQERPDIAELGQEPAGEQAISKGTWGSYLVQMPYATSILKEAEYV